MKSDFDEIDVGLIVDTVIELETGKLGNVETIMDLIYQKDKQQKRKNKVMQLLTNIMRK